MSSNLLEMLYITFFELKSIYQIELIRLILINHIFSRQL